jgi:hypothetical protein
MGTSTIIAGLNGELARPVKSARNETLTRKNELTAKLLAVLEAHQSVEHNINANESLSQAGKLEALAKLGNETTAPALKWTKNVIKEMQEKHQRYESQFNKIDSGIKDASERLPIYTYLWNKFDPMDQSARVTQFLQAAEQDQVVVMAAMLEHPLGPMINQEVRERGLTARARRLFPRDYENFEQNQILLEFLVTFRDWIARWLNQEVGVDIAVLRTNLGEDALSGLPVAA